MAGVGHFGSIQSQQSQAACDITAGQQPTSAETPREVNPNTADESRSHSDLLLPLAETPLLDRSNVAGWDRRVGNSNPPPWAALESRSTSNCQDRPFAGLFDSLRPGS